MSISYIEAKEALAGSIRVRPHDLGLDMAYDDGRVAGASGHDDCSVLACELGTEVSVLEGGATVESEVFFLEGVANEFLLYFRTH